MKLGTRPRHTSGGLNLSMTSMIDVVFLLLIFFLTTTSFVEPRRELAANTAVAETAQQGAQDTLEPAVVRLFRQGEVTFYSFGAVTTADEARIAGLLKAFGHKAPGAFVEVGPGVPFGDAARMLSLCQSAGFSPVTWLADDGGAPRNSGPARGSNPGE